VFAWSEWAAGEERRGAFDSDSTDLADAEGDAHDWSVPRRRRHCRERAEQQPHG
jgi:hypothetical protein